MKMRDFTSMLMRLDAPRLDWPIGRRFIIPASFRQLKMASAAWPVGAWLSARAFIACVKFKALITKRSPEFCTNALITAERLRSLKPNDVGYRYTSRAEESHDVICMSFRRY